MAKIEATILIQAQPNRVFAFMAEPHNLVVIWPSLLEIRNLELLPNGGYCYDWVYKMAGLRFEGRSRCTEFVKDRRIASRNEGNIPSTFVWMYEPEGAGTRVTMKAEYAIPGAALARLVEPIIDKMNQHEADTMLANLRARLEAEPCEVVSPALGPF
jgi:carbon monoxide dehydrogenase subunit G